MLKKQFFIGWYFGEEKNLQKPKLVKEPSAGPEKPPSSTGKSKSLH
jgi:hypothetical protein